MSRRHVRDALPRRLWSLLVLLALVGLAGLLAACAEPQLDEEDETDETDESVEPAPSAAPAPEEELLRAQLEVLVASVTLARDHLREAAEADALPDARRAGEAAVAQLVADGPLPDDQPPALLPAESVVRGDQRAHPDAVTPALSAARQAGGSLGDRAVGVLRDPIAGDLGTWERDPAGMIAQAEAAADPATPLETLDDEVLELGGDALRALTWALLLGEADDLELAQAYGERGAVHLDLILEALAQVVPPVEADGEADDADADDDAVTDPEAAP
jgi:hypothetical protein